MCAISRLIPQEVGVENCFPRCIVLTVLFLQFIIEEYVRRSFKHNFSLIRLFQEFECPSGWLEKLEAEVLDTVRAIHDTENDDTDSKKCTKASLEHSIENVLHE